MSAPATAITGKEPPAEGYAGRAIVMVVNPHGDLCTGVALTPNLVLTAGHCVAASRDYQLKTFQTGQTIAVNDIAPPTRAELEPAAQRIVVRL